MQGFIDKLREKVAGKINFSLNSWVVLSQLFVVGFCLTLTLAACTGNHQDQATVTPKISTLRVGYQKTGILLKNRGVLEKRLQPEGISVQWIDFPAGPQLLEALNVGSIDIGGTGESPPIFAQAAGASLVYVAGVAPSPASQAVLVPASSPIKAIADLKGKKIAFQKGSSAHYLLVQVLEKAGLKYDDIKPISLTPADARAAFIKGSIDAWVIWDPFYAAAEKNANARVLISGDNITEQGGYYLGSRKFVTDNPQIVKEVLEEIESVETWSDKNRDIVAKTLSPVLGIDLDTIKTVTQRRKFGIVPITDRLIEVQQRVADKYYELKLIPRKINIKDATLTPEQYAAISPKI